MSLTDLIQFDPNEIKLGKIVGRIASLDFSKAASFFAGKESTDPIMAE